MTVYSYGVFDLMHFGHLRLLKKAAGLGDKLIIGVFTDKVAESFKRKPIMTLKERMLFLEELGIGKVKVLKTLAPTEKDLRGVDIVAKAEGAGWDKKHIPSFGHARSILLNYTKGISTSEIIKRIYARNKQ